jgi:hypothetical protein
MKSYEEIAGSMIFPGTKNIHEREATLSEFRKYRKKIADNQSEKSILISRLLQLKFLIEDYIEDASLRITIKKS